MASGTVTCEIYSATTTGRAAAPTTARGITVTINVGDANMWIEDNVNTYSLPADTNFVLQITGAGDGGTLNIYAIELSFTPTDTSKTVSLYRTECDGTLTAPATEYWPLNTFYAKSATEANHQAKMPVAGTAKSLNCYCNIRTAPATASFILNNNGTAVLTISGINATGWWEEGASTAAVAAGDLLNFEHTNTGASGGTRIQFSFLEYETTDGTTVWVGNGVAAGTPTTGQFANGHMEFRATEAQKAIKVPFACNVHDAWINCGAYVSGDCKIALRDDGATSSTLVPSATSTGWFTDTSSDAVAADSVLSWIGTSGNAGNDLYGFTCAITNTEGAAAARRIFLVT